MKKNIRKLCSSFSSAWWEIRIQFWHHNIWQSLYVRILAVLRPELYSRTVNGNTDVVLEGVPRSANTFLVHALNLATRNELAIAHHLHDPCQIRCAERRQIPCFIIVRDPLDVAVSWKLKFPQLRAELILRIYTKFFQYAIQHRHAIGFLHYSDVIGHTKSVVAAIVRSIDPELQYDLGPVNSEIVFSSIDRRRREHSGLATDSFDLSVAHPTEAKELLRHTLREQISKEDALHLSEATRQYEAISACCIVVRENG